MPEPATDAFASQHQEVNYNSDMANAKSDFVRRLYRKYWLRLNRSVKGLVHDDDLAADIAQDSFVRVNTLEEPQKLEFPYAYLYRTAVNLIKDRAKAQKIRYQHQQAMSLDGNDNIDFLSPEHHAMAQQRLQRVSRAVDRLPPKCRHVFLLHRVHNLSHKEIAQSLGISTQAVEKHIMRAMARCQAAFEKDS